MTKSVNLLDEVALWVKPQIHIIRYHLQLKHLLILPTQDVKYPSILFLHLFRAHSINLWRNILIFHPIAYQYMNSIPRNRT